MQEAEDLYHLSNDDKNELLGTGLEPLFISDLPIRAGALREAQSIWIKEWNMHQQPEIVWEEMYKNAKALKKKILKAFDYAYRKDAEIKKR